MDIMMNQMLVLVLTMIPFNVSTAYNDTRGGRLLMIKLKLIMALSKNNIS